MSQKEEKNKGGRPTKLTEEERLLVDLFKRASKEIKCPKERFMFALWFREVFVNGKAKPKKRGIKYINQNQYQRDYYHRVIKNNPTKRLRLAFSALLNYHIKKNGESVLSILKEHLGYNLDDLKQHLENQFKEGMSWDNYGKWHIDHRIPASSFNYTSFEDKEFKKCWALENLQPLWAIDNLRKSNRLCVLQQ